MYYSHGMARVPNLFLVQRQKILQSRRRAMRILEAERWKAGPDLLWHFLCQRCPAPRFWGYSKCICGRQ